MDTKEVYTWIDELKIALLQKDSKKAFILTQGLPNFSLIQDKNDHLEALSSALELISQAIALLKDEQKSVSQNLKSIKQAKKFFI